MNELFEQIWIQDSEKADNSDEVKAVAKSAMSIGRTMMLAVAVGDTFNVSK
jgi:hypothetical protein